jgi:hypothetical protein
MYVSNQRLNEFDISIKLGLNKLFLSKYLTSKISIKNGWKRAANIFLNVVKDTNTFN